MNFRPLHDRILINRIEEKETVKGGIVIPDSAKEKPQEGEVVAVGKGKKEKDGQVVPLDVKAGDRILFGKYSGTEIQFEAFRPAGLKLQDGPSICFDRLKRELGAETEESRAAADFTIGERDIDEYLERYYPRQPLAKRAASG